eukprot:4405247-Lingulodinium_polyedra.AAC.1
MCIRDSDSGITQSAPDGANAGTDCYGREREATVANGGVEWLCAFGCALLLVQGTCRLGQAQ